MNVHLVDGTYELFRHFYGAPRQLANGIEVGASVGLARTLLSLLREAGVSHVACAFDHVIESFRNALYPGYKTGDGIEPDLFAQFSLAEEVTAALGIVVWPMVEFEADDALATGAARFAALSSVEQVVICTPDKDLAQSVSGSRVVLCDRRRRITYDARGVLEKFGVPPASIPDYLALVGDASDGYPGVPRWGEKSAAAVLSAWGHLERIPKDPKHWKVAVRGRDALAQSLTFHFQDALLYRTLATLRTDVPLSESIDDLEWRGVPREELEDLCRRLSAVDLLDQVTRWRG